MYKVLLADDERLDLEGMKTFIPWGELGMEVVEGVTNGFAACKVLEEQAVDILVTDIRMPNMSGLELAKRAAEIRKDIKVVFVSGYQDFQYAKQALKLNAWNYVLKPMDDQELIDSLSQIRKHLDEERSREAAYSQMEPLMRNEYLEQLLEGIYSDTVRIKLEQDYGLGSFAWPACAAVLEMDDLAWKLIPASDSGDRAVTDWMQQVTSLCRKHGIDYVCRLSRKRAALLLQEQTAVPVIEELLASIRATFPFTMTAGLGAPCVRLVEVQGSYRQAVEALDYKMFHGKGKLIQIGDVRRTEKEDIRHLDERLEALFSAMTRYELVAVHDEIEALFQAARSLKTGFTIRSFTLNILMKLDQYLHTMNEDLFQLLGIEFNKLDIIMQFETIQDIQSWLRRQVYELSELLHKKKQKKNWKLVQDVQRYVGERLADNITLKDAAEHFSFSPNYLGQLFKEETGQNFSEYLIALRMERAGELLRQTNLKIYEIAEQVGYRYLPYFSRQFKETYGMTPMEYRRS
ncbi:DNA-binding response regulator [Paenibacillus sambharensis]|uniref:DNA-binding response regulator n=1 Tax=Paenibacillus sambharensis TaxID=1803190 RepID=A0A2W1LHN2_9BACL|nr:response regulator [Paenibacillus sambharensis]PZD94562.1 DNA-binding response regulator [Paenibacillus sambharensis]